MKKFSILPTGDTFILEIPKPRSGPLANLLKVSNIESNI